MSEANGTYPRRDDEGRIVALPDLLGVTLAGVVIGVLALAVFDFAAATFGAGRFGGANGWLAMILPVWLFVEDFRAWRYGPARVVAALVAAALGLACGLLVAALVQGLPALAGGALGATAFTVVYATVWFGGVRWLTDRAG